MIKAIKTAGTAIVFLALFNFLFLFMAMAQIALEGRTGYWSPFWRIQADWVMRYLL